MILSSSTIYQPSKGFKHDLITQDSSGGLLENDHNRILSLFIAGLICGLIWEFWNYWAATKWVYLAPFTSNVRIFEMPIAGFLGFGPFAWEFFSMYYFVRLFRFKRD
jgi:hypothetical protein